MTNLATQTGTRPWSRIERPALVAGAGALVLAAVGGVFEPPQFFRSYLAPYLFWLGIALGSLAIVLLHNLTGGAWGIVLRPVLDAAARTLPLLALLFLPLAFGLHHVYPWARSDGGQTHELSEQKAQYLNTPFFLVRAAGYFAVWCAIAYFVTRWTRRENSLHTPREASGVRPAAHITQSVMATLEPDRAGLRLFSAVGMALYGLTATFAAIDWVMSLEPQWYSTIFGMLSAGGQALSSFAFAIAAIVLLPAFGSTQVERAGERGQMDDESRRDTPSSALTPDVLNDLGNLLLAFVMIWAYLAFSQFLIIWSGNLPEEIPWFLHRTAGGWQWVALALAVFYFALPFLALLARDIKRDGRRLATVAAGIVGMSFVAQFWTVVPAFHPRSLHVHWLDVAALIGLSGLWCGAFVRQLKSRSEL